MKPANLSEQLIAVAKELAFDVDKLKFKPPVTHIYNPLDYAWPAHEMYLRKFGNRKKRVVFLGMNPGPFGMAQTGIPFGEVKAVRDWMGLRAEVKRPACEHPKRPVLGFDCPRTEISGQRLWGLFAQRFGPADRFFREHYVANYCPLAFLSESGSNVTPDKLPKRGVEKLFAACDAHLRRIIEVLHPKWLIGVGGFAFQRLQPITETMPGLKAAQILHPSPASPAANRDWGKRATDQLLWCGAWKE